MNRETPSGAPSRPRPEVRARVAAVIGILAASLIVLACGHHDEPVPDAGPKGPAPSTAATGPASGAATPADAGEGAVRIVTPPSAPSAAPAATTREGSAASTPAASGPAPGTLSLRFIVRKKETKEELPAGSFEVRLLPLDAIREGALGSAGSAGPGAGVTTEAPRLDPGTPIGKAAPAAPSADATYQGSPEQVLVTQLDGSKRTFLAGVKPGTYAMRITAKGRRMLLEVLTVKAEDRLVERTLEPE